MPHRFISSPIAVLLLLTFGPVVASARAQQAIRPERAAMEEEAMQHFQALLRLDTSNPPGNETRVVEYLKSVLEREGIPVQIFAEEPDRANLVARLRGNGTKQPILLMGHTDVVTAIPERWRHPPFAAVRDSGYVYGRGALDDKDNLVASLMVLVMLKRMQLPLHRDVIFLAEAGEEGTTWVGIEPMTEKHFPAIEAEYCLAEGGGVRREGGQIRFASVSTLEKVPRGILLTARGPSGHGSIPLSGNAIGRLASAIAAIEAWETPIRLNQTTREYFRRLATISPREEAQRFEAVLSGDSEQSRNAVEYFTQHTPNYAAMVRTSISPTIIQGGNRINVIPSEATAQLDVRLLPDQDPDEVLDLVRRLVNDSSIEVAFVQTRARLRPPGQTSIDTEAFRAIESAISEHYGTLALPTMSTGATDMAFLRAKGMNCYGIGPLTDFEDTLQGFGGHGNQERIIEAELHRFLRFYWDVVTDLVTPQ